MAVPQPRFPGVSLTGEHDDCRGFPGMLVRAEAPDQPSLPYTSLSRRLDPPASLPRKSEISARRQAHSPPGTTVRNTFIEVDEAVVGGFGKTVSQAAGPGLRGHAGSSHIRCGSEPPRDIRFSKRSSDSSSTGRATMSSGSSSRKYTSLVSMQGVDHRWEYLCAEGMEEAPDSWQGRADANYDCPLNSNVDALAAVSGYAEWVSAQWNQSQLPEGADGGLMRHAADSYSGHEWLMAGLPQHDPRGDFGYTASELAWTEQHFHEFPDSLASRPPGRFELPSEDGLAEAMHVGFGAGVAAGVLLRDGEFRDWPSPSASGWGGPPPTNARGQRPSRRDDLPNSTAHGIFWREEHRRRRCVAPVSAASCEPYEFVAAGGHALAPPVGVTTNSPEVLPSQMILGRSADCQVVWCDARAFKEASDAMRRELEERTQLSVKAYKSAERCIRLLRKKQHAQGRPRCVFLISWSNAPALVPFLASVPHIVARVVLLVDTGRSCHHEAADHLARLFPCVAGVAQTWAEALEIVAAAVRDHQAREA